MLYEMATGRRPRPNLPTALVADIQHKSPPLSGQLNTDVLAGLLALVAVPGRTNAPRVESLAVLPLRNLSGDPQQEYFAVAEALITDLAKISALRVISRTSVV